jgi:hypothetical protein
MPVGDCRLSRADGLTCLSLSPRAPRSLPYGWSPAILRGQSLRRRGVSNGISFASSGLLRRLSLANPQPSLLRNLLIYLDRQASRREYRWTVRHLRNELAAADRLPELLEILEILWVREVSFGGEVQASTPASPEVQAGAEASAGASSVRARDQGARQPAKPHRTVYRSRVCSEAVVRAPTRKGSRRRLAVPYRNSTGRRVSRVSCASGRMHPTPPAPATSESGSAG